MNNEIQKNSELLRGFLLKEPVIQEYIQLKKCIDNDEILRRKLLEMQYYKNCNPDSDNYEQTKKLYSDLMSEPMILNYFTLQQEVEDLFTSIKKELL